MRILTVWATVSLPLVVLTGYFGMNFDHLPLLQSKTAALVTTASMILVPVGLLLWFRKRGWM